MLEESEHLEQAMLLKFQWDAARAQVRTPLVDSILQCGMFFLMESSRGWNASKKSKLLSACAVLALRRIKPAMRF